MNFKNDRHTLYCGWVIGLMIKHHLQASPMVDEEGNYVPSVLLEVGGETIILEIPEPDEEWSL